MQQLRGSRSRRHGAGAEDPRYRAREEGRHHRPVRPDHALARRDVPRRRRDGARGFRPAAVDRRRDHEPRAHGGEDQPELPSQPGDLRDRREPRGRRGLRADVARGAAESDRQSARRVYAHGRSLTRAARPRSTAPRLPTPAPTAPRSTGRATRRPSRAFSARARSRLTTSPSSPAISTGRRSSRPGNSRARSRAFWRTTNTARPRARCSTTRRPC